MSTNPTPLQQAIQEVEQIGVAAASPFIHSTSGQATEQKVIGEVNLGIAALPLLEQLFHAIAGLFHHTHAVATQAAPTKPVDNPPTGA